ncbi:MAG: aminotransferase class I/II-fold pyridoxal phosphate-dependent enzyme [Erysipelotrichaceae bacterium]|nr:aminotransferase class I/II-fold pyridoxal phosphate-dependent enzyme [Erysipelotrichaceae bacterium]
MSFVKKSIKSIWKPDTVFSIMASYKKYVEENGKAGATNAIIGSLCDEEGKLVTYKSVFESERSFPDTVRAAYPAGLKGNPEYIEAMKNWVLDGNSNLYSDGIATVGGTGAVFVALDLCLEANEAVLLPEIAWGSYQLMANEFNFDVVNYDVYDIDDMLNKAESIANKQGKLVLVINSPCQNPCGQSLNTDEWKKIVNKLNEIAKKAEVVLVNDIAYIDYAREPKEARKYIQTFDELNENVLVLICASTSKSFSYYGQRLGELIILNKNEKTVEEVEKAAELKVRCTWSTCSNIAMSNVAQVINSYQNEYVDEKKAYIDILYKRAEAFVNEAKEVGLDIYDFKEGFFVTLKFTDENKRDEAHQKLLDNHIYTVKTVKGIRVAICSMPVKEIEGLAKRIKAVIA